MGRFVRNPFPLPLIQYEEGLTEPITLEGFEYDWKQHESTSNRLYYHHTMASFRHYHLLKQLCAPKDKLDIALSTIYDHSKDSFNHKNWIYVQPETVGLPTFRLLKNVRFIPDKRPARDLLKDEVLYPESRTLKPGTKWHGIKQGGISERVNVNSVKLGITSNHGSQSNRGYSRKIDGTFFSS